MKHWMEYVKASYEVILEAEAKVHINLTQEVEAYVVHTFARYMENPKIATDPIAIKMLTAVGERGQQRKEGFERIAEECLLIDGLELGSRRWPTKTYYRDMGRLALEHRAWVDRPPELFFERIASEFSKLSEVLHGIRTPLGP